MKQVDRQTVEALKSHGAMFAAGALAFSLGLQKNSYGCHYGMRSTLYNDRAEYERGWEAANKKDY